MSANAKSTLDFDAIIVGAGFAGLYQLHKLRGLGLRTHVFDAASDVGGTWYWNRYPGARCDIESIGYSYSFSPELEQEWRWTEKFATQPEILRYAAHVADRFDLRKDITFNTRIKAATYDEAAKLWRLETEDGDEHTCQYLIMATGCLSAPNTPDIPGLDRFKGETYHTATWPHEPVDFSGKRVGVIGTGSSGIQSIPLIAQEAAEVHVFQRTPSFSLPAQNRLIDDDEDTTYKEIYHEFREGQRSSQFGTPVELPTTSALEAPAEERNAAFEKEWNRGTLLGFFLTYNDVLLNEDANDTIADFIRGKIDEIVDDPKTAETLSPHSYPVGTKRICLDTDYYKTFNLDHVHLVDAIKTPIEEITETGIRTSAEAIDLDVIVLATGFDAITGALERIDIKGRDGATLKSAWEQGGQAYLGLMVNGFPNMFTVNGPQSPSVISNVLVSIEQHVEWITDCITWLRNNNLETIEATKQAQDDWVAHANDVAEHDAIRESRDLVLGREYSRKAARLLTLSWRRGPLPTTM